MCPRTKEQNDEIRERRKLQIIETAETLFLLKGLNLDIRDVAQAAGLGYGTVYHYYNNKHLLIDDIMAAGFHTAEALAGQLDGAQSPLTRLHRYFRLLPDCWTRSRAAFAVYKHAADNFAWFEEELKQQYNHRFETHIYAPVAAVIEQAIQLQELPGRLDPQQTANTLLGSLIGAYSIYMSHDNRRFDADFTANLLIKGIQEG